MSGVMAPTYQSGFAAPGRGTPKYPELWRGCVGAWNPGLGQSGLVLRDWSGRGNNGTLTNGPTWGVSGGRQALNFDGVDDYVDIPSNAAIKPGTGSYSAVLWVYPKVNNKGHDFIADRALGAVGTTSGFVMGSLGGITAGEFGVLFEATDGSYKLYLVSSGIYSANQWYCFAFTFDNVGNKLTVYKDGIDITSLLTKINDDNLTGKNISSAQSLIIGNRPGTTSRALSGLADDVRIYNASLPPSLIKLLATRPGIAYDLAPRKVYSIPAAVGTRQYKLLRPSILRGA